VAPAGGELTRELCGAQQALAAGAAWRALTEDRYHPRRVTTPLAVGRKIIGAKE
jgi:hypothetical protein